MSRVKNSGPANLHFEIDEEIVYESKVDLPYPASVIYDHPRIELIVDGEFVLTAGGEGAGSKETSFGAVSEDPHRIKREFRQAFTSLVASSELPFVMECLREQGFKLVRIVREPISSDAIPDDVEKWPGHRHTDEDLVRFVRRVWGNYFKQKIVSRKVMIRKDKKLVFAIREHRKDKDWPLDLRFVNGRRSAKEVMRKADQGVEKLTDHELVSLGRILEKRLPKQPIIKPRSRALRSG